MSHVVPINSYNICYFFLFYFLCRKIKWGPTNLSKLAKFPSKLERKCMNAKVDPRIFPRVWMLIEDIKGGDYHISISSFLSVQAIFKKILFYLGGIQKGVKFKQWVVSLVQERKSLDCLLYSCHCRIEIFCQRRSDGWEWLKNFLEDNLNLIKKRGIPKFFSLSIKPWRISGNLPKKKIDFEDL